MMMVSVVQQLRGGISNLLLTKDLVFDSRHNKSRNVIHSIYLLTVGKYKVCIK